MSKFIKFISYALIFLLVIFLGLVLFTQLVYAQEAECVLVYDDDDEPGFYDELNFTDSQEQLKNRLSWERDLCATMTVSMATPFISLGMNRSSTVSLTAST